MTTNTETKPGEGNCVQAARRLAEQERHRLARGWYTCPVDGNTYEHWWCVAESGLIVDPTADQFLSNGTGGAVYREAPPALCEVCGKEVETSSPDFPWHGGECMSEIVGTPEDWAAQWQEDEVPEW